MRNSSSHGITAVIYRKVDRSSDPKKSEQSVCSDGRADGQADDQEDGWIYGFHIFGHAGYDRYGHDIVCAAVSVLAINTVNSIEQFTGDRFQTEQSDGEFRFRLDTCKTPETQLLLKSFILGLESIRDTYGDKYMRIINRIREV